MLCDAGDFIYLVRRAGLVEFPCAVAIVVLFECLPVAGRIESPLLLKNPTGDRRLTRVQCSMFSTLQLVG